MSHILELAKYTFLNLINLKIIIVKFHKVRISEIENFKNLKY